MSMKQKKSRSLCVLGSPAVGKTSMTQQFVNEKYDEAYNPTIDSTFNKDISYKGSDFTLSIIDTAGQDEHSRLTNAQQLVDGYVMVCSVASRQSFETIQILNEKILDHANPNIPRLIVLNKTDLPARQHQVTHDDLVALGERLKCSIAECSAKSHSQVNDVFLKILAEIEKGSEPPPAKKSGKCIVL